MKNFYLRIALIMVAVSLNLSAFAQMAISGTIVDAANGDPIIGANIIVKGTTTGTVTDFDGNFNLSAPEGAVIQFSYMGYKSVELPAQASMIVKLSEDSEQLEELVVVGYGTVKKNDATGSVTAIKPDDMNKGLTQSAQDLLSGKIAGVSVTNNGGTPGGAATIRIRGGSSLNASNDPLIVIDGLAMDNNGIKGAPNALAMVNPSDIETFTVLKDASATAIYGSRASNGVIIITTKKGSSGQKLKVQYDGSVSVNTLTNRLETLTGDQVRQYATALGHDASKTCYLGTANTDWQDQIYRPAVSTDHNVSIMGGFKDKNCDMPYRASVGYTLNNGIIKTSQMQRVTASLNLSPSFLDKHLVFNLNAKGMYTANQYAAGVVGAAISMDPTMPVMGAGTCIDGSTRPSQEVADRFFGGYYQVPTEGNYNDPVWTVAPSSQSTKNPVASLNQKDDRAKSGCFVGNLEADYKIHGLEDLHLHANFGADYSYGKQNTVFDVMSAEHHYYGETGYTWEKKYNLQFNAYAQYGHDWEAAKQHFDIMAGYEWQHFKRWGESSYYGTYPQTNNEEALRGTQYNRSDNSWGTENYLVSFFGRMNYIGWNQLMITATVRGDGSSRFAKGKKWGVFPSVALGWKIKETFMKDVNEVSDLKLRLGWGITGQQDIGEDYAFLPKYTISQEGAYYPIGTEPYVAHDANGNVLKDKNGNVVYNTYRPGAYNPNLTWEKTTTYNAGIDLGFLNQRITSAIDFYYRDTRDLIQSVSVPAGTNFKNRVISNVGSLRNMGVEFSFNAVAVDRKNFKWDLGFNFTWNDNKITSLTNTTGDSDKNYFIETGGISSGSGNTIQVHKVGETAASFYVFETQKKVDENGKTQYYLVDRNEDGQITVEDRYCYHSGAAPFMIGFQTKFQFYHFDLGITLRSNIGNYVYNDVLASNLQWVESGKICNAGYHGLLRSAFDTYWVDGMKSDGLKDQYGGTYNDWFKSDYFVENASFLRCDNITLGYSFEKNPKVKARLYATVSNPFVISKYKGLDPEVFGGIDNNMYPRSMAVLVGTNITF